MICALNQASISMNLAPVSALTLAIKELDMKDDDQDLDFEIT